MKYLILTILFTFTLANDLNKIARINTLKKEAKEAYLAGDYRTAIEKYRYLIDSLDVEDDKVFLNLSNAYYSVKDTSNAVSYYQILTRSETPQVQSIAWQQLGNIDALRKQYKQALLSFKESLKANPANDEARYNYELMKKLLKEQEKQKEDEQKKKKDQKNKDQDKKEQQEQQEKDQQQQQQEDQEKQQQQQKQDSENQEGEEQQEQEGESEQKKEGEQKQDDQKDGEEKEQPAEKKDGKEKELESIRKKLKEMNISMDKARMILEAMKNNEIQYIQENKRKAKTRKKSGKPDW